MCSGPITQCSINRLLSLSFVYLLVSLTCPTKSLCRRSHQQASWCPTCTTSARQPRSSACVLLFARNMSLVLVFVFVALFLCAALLFLVLCCGCSQLITRHVAEAFTEPGVLLNSVPAPGDCSQLMFNVVGAADIDVHALHHAFLNVCSHLFVRLCCIVCLQRLLLPGSDRERRADQNQCRSVQT